MDDKNKIYDINGVFIKCEFNRNFDSDNDADNYNDFNESNLHDDSMSSIIPSENDSNSEDEDFNLKTEDTNNQRDFNFQGEDFNLRPEDFNSKRNSQINDIYSKATRAYSPEAQILSYNIFLYFHEKLGYSKTKAIRETSKASGISERTIHKIKSKISLGADLDWKNSRKPFYKNSRKFKYTDDIINGIKDKLTILSTQKTHFTLIDILKLINEDSKLPNFKRTTLINLFNDNGIFFKRTFGKKGIYTFKK